MSKSIDIIKEFDQIEKKFDDTLTCIIKNDPNPLVSLSIEKMHLDFYLEMIQKIKNKKDNTAQDLVTLALIAKNMNTHLPGIKKRKSKNYTPMSKYSINGKTPPQKCVKMERSQNSLI